FGASEQSLGNKLTKSLHVLVDGGHLWPLAEQFLEPTTRSTAKEQRTKSGKERSRVAHANIRIYTYIKTSFFDEKSRTFSHPNCGSQKTLRALQNSDLSPRLGDSRQSEPKPQGNWRWTRKVKAKTVTVALSDQQAELFRRAIDDHRKLEKLIDQMRALSQQCSSTPSKDPHVEKEEYHPK